MTTTRRAFLAASLSVFMLAGCGFHRRGKVTLPFNTLFLALPTNSKVGADLKRRIGAASDVAFVTDRNNADAILELLNDTTSRRVISLNTNGEAREYEISLVMTFRVSAPDGSEFMAPRTFRTFRNITYSETDYLSRNNEERLLLNEMRETLITQFLTVLSSIKKP